MTLLNHFRIRVVVPGDIEMKAGDMIDYEFPLFESAQTGGKKFDKARSGKYLVASINHKFRSTSYECVAELVADSFSEAMPVAKDGLNKLTKKGK
jgi:hypothetical protein